MSALSFFLSLAFLFFFAHNYREPGKGYFYTEVSPYRKVTNSHVDSVTPCDIILSYKPAAKQRLYKTGVTGGSKNSSSLTEHAQGNRSRISNVFGYISSKLGVAS